MINYMSRNTKEDIYKIPAILLVTSFYFSQYISFVPGITIGELVLLVGSILIIIYKNFLLRIRDNKIIILYYSVAMISSIIAIALCKSTFSVSSQVEVFSRWIRYFFYVVSIIIYCDNYTSNEGNARFLVNVYKFACNIVAIYGILQFLTYTIAKIYLPVNILPLKISRDVNVEMLADYADKYIMRVKAVFVEPGYFVQYLLPGFVLSLYGWNERRTDKKSLLLIGIAIILSRSVQGYILMFAVIVGWIVTEKRLEKKELITYIFVILAIGIIVYILLNSSVSSGPLKRIQNILNNDSIDRSTQVRVFRGFAFWGKLPLQHKILGVGMGNVANYADQYNVTTLYDYYNSRSEASLGYMSGLTGIMVSSGILCLFISIFTVYSFHGKLKKVGFWIYVIFFASLLGGGSFLSVLGVLYFALAFCFRYESIE